MNRIRIRHSPRSASSSAESGSATAPGEAGNVAPDLVACDPLSVLRAREIVRQQLDPGVTRLFQKLAGGRLHVHWYAGVAEGPESRPLMCPAVWQRRGRGGMGCRCARCLAERWKTPVAGDGRLRRFAGRCGSVNWIATLALNHRPLAALILQSRGRNCAKKAIAPASLRLLQHVLDGSVQAALASRGASGPDLRVSPNRPPPKSLSPVPNGAPGRRIVQAMLDYVQRCYRRPLNLGEVAASLRRNPKYLAHVFAAAVGVSFKHYVEQLRMAEAERLLEDGTLTVGEVAAALGFSGADHFRHAFKHRMGLSPARWRGCRPGS